MKLLLDFFPIVVFFGVFKLADIYVATAAAIVATALQLGALKLKGRPIGPMHWTSLAVIVLFGGATLLLRDETFIKWKPSILYWLFAVVLTASSLFWKRNLVRLLLAAQLPLPDAVWSRLSWLWVGFFTLMGGLNLAVAYRFSTDTWVSFKLFGSLGLTLAFLLGQGLYLSRYVRDDPPAS